MTFMQNNDGNAMASNGNLGRFRDLSPTGTGTSDNCFR